MLFVRETCTRLHFQTVTMSTHPKTSISNLTITFLRHNRKLDVAGFRSLWCAFIGKSFLLAPGGLGKPRYPVGETELKGHFNKITKANLQKNL